MASPREDDPVLPTRRTASKYPVSRYSHGPSRLPSQIYLSHALHGWKRNHLIQPLLSAARQGRIEMVLRLFRICLRDNAQMGGLSPDGDMLAASLDLIDLVIFRFAAPDHRVRAELRQRLQDMTRAAKMSLYNPRGQYRTWPEQLERGAAQDGLVTTFVEGRDEYDSLAEDSEPESGDLP